MHADDVDVAAAHVIVAVPPTLAGRIAYEPPLPARRDQLTQRVPAGSVIKCHAVYDTPFWRHAGLTGQATGDRGPAKVVFDNSPPEGTPGVLLAFLEGAAARQLNRVGTDERRAAVIGSLVEFFGPQAADPVEFVELDWSEEEWPTEAEREKEVEHNQVVRARAEAIRAVDDPAPAAVEAVGEQPHPGPQLIDVDAPAQIAQVLEGVAVIILVSCDFLALPANALLLGCDGLFKRQGLVAQLARVVVLGKGAVDRVAQEHDELDPRQQASCSPGHLRMKEIRRAGLPRDKVLVAKAPGIGFLEPGWEVGAVPAHPLLKFSVEEMHLFRAGRMHSGMRPQVVVEGGGAAALRADDQKIGQEPQWAGHPAIQLLQRWRRSIFPIFSPTRNGYGGRRAFGRLAL